MHQPDFDGSIHRRRAAQRIDFWCSIGYLVSVADIGYCERSMMLEIYLTKRKHRPRKGRLTGADMTQLRLDCFTRDNFRCQHEMKGADRLGYNGLLCLKPISWESGHMAHVKSRGAGGTDTLDNVITKCAHCHLVREHTQGEK